MHCVTNFAYDVVVVKMDEGRVKIGMLEDSRGDEIGSFMMMKMDARE